MDQFNRLPLPHQEKVEFVYLPIRLVESRVQRFLEIYLVLLVFGLRQIGSGDIADLAEHPEEHAADDKDFNNLLEIPVQLFPNPLKHVDIPFPVC